MPDEDGDDAAFEAAMEHRFAFEARFPLEAFEPVAHALNTTITPENLQAIRGWLMPSLHQSFSGSVFKEPSHKARIAKLRKLRDALALLRDALSGSIFDSPWTVRDLIDVGDKLPATLNRLYRGVEKSLRELEATPARRGRRPKTEFRDFAQELIWVYEKMTGRTAIKPYWLGDSRIYGGEFYRFAVAVWRCIGIYVPEVKKALPPTDGALAQALQDHWPKGNGITG